MDIQYFVIKGKIYTENQELTTYGISAVDRKTALTKSEFDDISFNIDLVCRLADLMNLEKIELCHFYDVVLDELNR